MSKRVNPFRNLTWQQQRALKRRIELIAPEIQMGMSAARLIVALFDDLAAVPTRKMNSRTCQKPDRDNPKMKCGYPLPCPHHTLIVDLETKTITQPFGLNLSPRARRRVETVAKALSTKEIRRPRNPKPKTLRDG